MTTRYLTVGELKSYVRSELTSDDSAYEAAIQTAELIIDNATARRFIIADPSVSTARVFVPSGGEYLFIDDAVAIVSVTDNGAALVSGTDYQAEPLNALSDSGESVPYHTLRRLGYYYSRWYNWYGIPNSATISVTARWGWPSIPALVKESCKIVAKDVFLNRDTAGFGLVTITDAGGIGTRENRIVQQMVTAYAHPRAIVIG
jgi:hypothetical protein